jgi:hypothetical protein
MRHLEIIADNLDSAGWSLGWVSAADAKGRRIWIVDAHSYGKGSSCTPKKYRLRLLNWKERHTSSR